MHWHCEPNKGLPEKSNKKKSQNIDEHGADHQKIIAQAKT